jgi:threonylcarbamoyladenosine tRNA methylthiotransferase MtaB
VEIITLGCRLNIYESEVMREHALHNGLDNTIIVNTCAVTNEAERQSRQAIRKAKREHPTAKIIVTGCSAQINPSVYQAMPEVDLVLGNQEKMQRESFHFTQSEKVRVNDIMEVKETASHLIAGFEDHSRAFIQIQNGCNHRCTFCTIPFARGNNRSVPLPEIITQVRQLVEQGCQEIVLTGVDITDYGSDLPGTPRLGQLVRRLLSHIPELPRLRLSSLDPVECDDDLFRLIGCEPRLMPHLHLSLQSGDDMILKRMKRRHLSQDIIKFCERVRALRPDVVLGCDVIAGFPTETEAMFHNSLTLLEDYNFTYVHAFSYSARQGTPASRMPQLPGNVIKERSARLRALGEKQQWAFFTSRLNTVASVLVEKNNRGHSEHFAPVRLANTDTIYHRQIMTAKIIGADAKGLIAEPQ